MISYTQACKRVYDYYHGFITGNAYRGLWRAGKTQNGWVFAPDLGGEHIIGGPDIIYLDFIGCMYRPRFIPGDFDNNVEEILAKDVYLIELPEQYLSNRFRNYKRKYINIHFEDMKKKTAGISLYSLILGAKTNCVACNKGHYYPKNPAWKLNHIYVCNECGDMIEFDPTSFSGWKKLSGIKYDPIEDTTDFMEIVDAIDNKARKISINKHFEQYKQGNYHGMSDFEIFLVEKKHILLSEYGIDWSSEIELNPDMDLLQNYKLCY